MEQLNMVLPETQEEKTPAAVAAFERKPGSPLLDKVHHNFGFFGSLSLFFGLLFALLYFKAGIGLNTLLFTLGIIILLDMVMKKLSLPVKTGTKFYYAGALLLSISTVLTGSGVLQFLNVIGILLLFNLSLLHQFYEDSRWDFVKHFFRMIGLFFQSIAAVAMPFIDCYSFMKRTRVFGNDRTRNIFLGIFISIPLLGIVGALLANADLLFSKLTGKMFHMVFSSDILVVGFMVLFGFLACYCIICASVTKAKLAEEKEFRKADASIAITLMVLLSLVYAVFCGIQVIYLFANGLFMLPESFTFAEYARRGFFELLAVAIINVSLMVFCRFLFSESKWLNLMITFMTVCTYIMIASSAYRMFLYIGAYHLTFLRVFVLLSLLIIALILAGVILSVYNRRFPLFRYCVAVVSICYIAFSFSKPDYYIASYLIDRTQLLDREDIGYLTRELSLDAAPAVLPLLADRNRWTLGFLADSDRYDSHFSIGGSISDTFVLDDYRQRIEAAKPDRDIRDFNYSGYLADKYLKKYPQN